MTTFTSIFSFFVFFFNDTATTEIYTLSLHDALPIDADHATETLADTLEPDQWPRGRIGPWRKDSARALADSRQVGVGVGTRHAGTLTRRPWTAQPVCARDPMGVALRPRRSVHGPSVGQRRQRVMQRIRQFAPRLGAVVFADLHDRSRLGEDRDEAFKQVLGGDRLAQILVDAESPP